MSATYTYRETLDRDLDMIRVKLGDTDMDPNKVLLTDEHILTVLDQQGSVNAAVAFLADELILRFSQQPVKKASAGVSVDFSVRIPVLQAIAAQARETTITGAPSPAARTHQSGAVKIRTVW